MKNIVKEETEEQNKRVANNYWKLRSFLNNGVIWDMQIHVTSISPMEEQIECLNFIKENEHTIKKNGLYVPSVDENISIDEEERRIFQRTLERRRYTEKKFNRTYVTSDTPAYANRDGFILSEYEMERKLNYGNNKYGKKIIRNRDRGIR